MKIKTTKQMRLDELLKYAWDNEIDLGCVFSESREKELYLYSEGVNFNHLDNGVILQNQTFTISTEEELTEETELSAILTGVKSSDGRMVYRQHTSLSIARVKEEMSLACIEPIVVYATDLNRPMNEITLIWSKDAGIPAEGVIEV